MLKPHLSFRSAVLGTALFLAASAAEAGLVTYGFTGAVDSGALLGETYSGQASFDDAGLTGSGSESLAVSTLTFSFLGNTFTEASGTGTPTADFLDGVFLGLSYEVTAFDPDFSLISGSSDTSDAYFAYTPVTVTDPAGFGSLAYAASTGAAPEPATLALLMGGLALLGHRRRTARA